MTINTPYDDPEMDRAYALARDAFKFFWRELSWEQRRIVPGLDLAAVKISFDTNASDDDAPGRELMWVGEVDFDGQHLTGRLLNSSSWVPHLKEGDIVEASMANLCDWLYVSLERVFGGFSVNLMRSRMDKAERKDHDSAWGFEFGDPKEVLVAYADSTTNDHFVNPLLKDDDRDWAAPQEHPMCLNMAQSFPTEREQIDSIINYRDSRGWNMLHLDALAGNLATVRLMVEHGIDPAARTPDGRSAYELARDIGWHHVASFLSQIDGDNDSVMN